MRTRFRLSSVLRLREAELEQQRRGMAQEQAAREAAERALVVAEGYSGDAERGRQRQLSAGSDALALRITGAHAETCRLLLARAEERRDEAETRVADARERLLEAWRDVRSLALLRRRALDAWRRELERRERVEAEEAARRLRRPDGRER